MAITATTTTRHGGLTVVTVTSDLSGTVYYHWYIDDTYSGLTQSPSKSFQLERGSLARIEVIDTNDPDFDPVTDAPGMFPARYTLWWVRSLDDSTVRYRIRTDQNFGGYEVLGYVPHDSKQWTYQFVTPRLTDLAHVDFEVRPVDAAGNVGQFGPDMFLVGTVVRVPDAPDFAISFNPGTLRVTFSESS